MMNLMVDSMTHLGAVYRHKVELPKWLPSGGMLADAMLAGCGMANLGFVG